MNSSLSCRLIPDALTAENPNQVKRVIFCTGRVYYDLLKARRDRKLDHDIAISRIEQVHICSSVFFQNYYL